MAIIDKFEFQQTAKGALRDRHQGASLLAEARCAFRKYLSCKGPYHMIHVEDPFGDVMLYGRGNERPIEFGQRDGIRNPFRKSGSPISILRSSGHAAAAHPAP